MSVELHIARKGRAATLIRLYYPRASPQAVGGADEPRPLRPVAGESWSSEFCYVSKEQVVCWVGGVMGRPSEFAGRKWRPR